MMYKLKDNETGYDYVGSMILDAVEKNSNLHYEDYIVRIRYSYDGEDIDEINEYMTWNFNDNEWIEFLNDWWEGQQYVEVLWMCPISKIKGTGVDGTFWFENNWELQ